MKQITKRTNGTKKVVTVNNEPSRTQEQWLKSTDVNEIMKKYKKTGTITHVRNAEQGVYMDLTEIPDYATALMQIKKAETAFQEMPALLRQKFNHDPQSLINFLSDPKNHKEAVELGLMVKTNDEQNPKPIDESKPPQVPTPPPQPPK